RTVWVGRASDFARDFAARYDIQVTGYVPDVRPYLRSAACYVAPLRVGGGTRLKILDAWAMGNAVVSTSIGCEGLDARDGENILVRGTPAAFADAVVRVLEDAALRERLGRAARATAEQVYDWQVIGRSMLPHYVDLLGGRDAAARGSAAQAPRRPAAPAATLRLASSTDGQEDPG